MPCIRVEHCCGHFHFIKGLRRLTVLGILLTVLMGVGPRTAGATLTDEDIGTAVETQLLIDDAVTAHTVDIHVKQGIVTVTGSVDNLLAAERAVRIAATVKNVRAVVNRIEIAAAERRDEDIRKDVTETLLFDPVADAGEVEVEVSGQQVVLRGMVDSWQEKRLVGLAVKRVPGIQAFDNRLAIAEAAQRGDDEIRVEIEARLRWDIWVEASEIEVRVDNGHVKLSGTVASLAEKQRSIEDAWIRGVQSVDADTLSVDWLSARANLRTKLREVQDDQEVAQAIRLAWRHDPRVPADKIDVRVNGGIATMRGTVDVLAAAHAAEIDAVNTVGVWMVRNLIKTRPASGSGFKPVGDADTELARQVRMTLLLEPQIRQDLVSVTVTNRLVLLRGQVPSAHARERATRAASGIRGVTAVVNNLEVATPRRSDRREDWQIRQGILDELRWSPYVDDDMVAVTVNDGVALLTGVVDDLRARRVATANALEGGAVQVRNRLRVRHGPDFLRP
ncbi:MAG: BON domain-containing protein [Desulfobacterales bacterium]